MRNKRKAAKWLTAFLILLLMAAWPAGGPVWAADFFGVQDFERYTEPDGDFHWAMNDLKLVVSSELMKGYPPEGPEEMLVFFRGTGAVFCKVLGPFKPDALITRAEYASIVARALDLEGKSFGESPFADVSTGEWYGPNVVRLVEAGVIDPADYGSEFRPNERITRLEIAVWMVRAAEKAGVRTEPAAVSFKDFDSTSKFATYVGKAVALGILKGYPDGTFRPSGTANRAEAAVMLVRLLKHLPLFPGLDRETAGQIIQKVIDAQVKCQKSWPVKVDAGWEINPQFEAALKVFQEETRDILTDYNRWPRMHAGQLAAISGLAQRDEVGPWTGDWAAQFDAGYGMVDSMLLRWEPRGVGVPIEYIFTNLKSVDVVVGHGPIAEVQFTASGGAKYSDGTIYGGDQNVSPYNRALLVKQDGKWKVAALWVDGRGPWLKLIGFAES